MNRYLIDKAFSMMNAAEKQNNIKLWREAAYSAIEALADADPYADEKMGE